MLATHLILELDFILVSQQITAIPSVEYQSSRICHWLTTVPRIVAFIK